MGTGRGRNSDSRGQMNCSRCLAAEKHHHLLLLSCGWLSCGGQRFLDCHFVGCICYLSLELKPVEGKTVKKYVS